MFCASTSLTGDLRSVARELGRALGAAGDELVYGGTLTGLMGEVAAGARETGGRVVGVVPAAIAALGHLDGELDELVEVDTLGERKVAMLAGTRRVVVLAGGLGTLDELLEALTMRQLGLLPADLDLVVLDPDDHWRPLRDQLDVLVDRGATLEASVRVRWERDVAGALRLDSTPDSVEDA